MKSTFKDSSFFVIKCIGLVFNFSNKASYYGFLDIFISLTGHIPLIILYFIRGKKSMIDFIFSEMEKNNYLLQKFNPIKKKTTHKDKTKIYSKREKKFLKNLQVWTILSNLKI